MNQCIPLIFFVICHKKNRCWYHYNIYPFWLFATKISLLLPLLMLLSYWLFATKCSLLLPLIIYHEKFVADIVLLVAFELIICNDNIINNYHFQLLTTIIIVAKNALNATTYRSWQISINLFATPQFATTYLPRQMRGK